MANQTPIYSQVLPKNRKQPSPALQAARASRAPQPSVFDADFDPLNHNRGGNFDRFASIPTADAYSRVEKFARESARRSSKENNAVRSSSGKRHLTGSSLKHSDRPINLRSITLNESPLVKHPYDRTPTDYSRDPLLLREYVPCDPSSSFREGIRDLPRDSYVPDQNPRVNNSHRSQHRVSARESTAIRDAIYENESGLRGAIVQCEVIVPDASNRVHSMKKSNSSHRMTSTPNSDKRTFFCREWAFQKLAHALDQRPISKTCGTLILGDSGSGKTAFCKELAHPGSGPAARQQRALQRRMIAKHFMQGNNDNSITMTEFIRTLVKQILSHATQNKQQASQKTAIPEQSMEPSSSVDTFQDQDKLVNNPTPSAPSLDLLETNIDNVEDQVSLNNNGSDRMRNTMERIHEREQYEDLMPSLENIKISNESPQKKPPPRISNTNPFLPNFEKQEDVVEQKLYENHENLFLRNVSQQPKDCRNSKLYRQQSEPPITEKKLSVFQKSLSTDSKVSNEESYLIENSKVVSDSSSKDDKDPCDKIVITKTPLSPSNASNFKASRIPIASFKYPNMSALSSAENSPSRSKYHREAEKNSASDNSESNSKSSSKKCNQKENVETKKPLEIVDAEKTIVLEDELPEYQNVLKPPNYPKEISPKIEKCLDDLKLNNYNDLNDEDYDKSKFREQEKSEDITKSKVENGDDVPPPIPSLPVNPRTLIANAYYEKLMTDPEMQQALLPHNLEKNPDDCFKKALLFPLLEIDPPKQCLFLLVDSIDENPLPGSTTLTSTLLKDRDKSGSDSSGLAMRNINSSKTIAELLANHHHLFPQWLLLVCTARKQSKYLTKMFTGFRKISLDDLRKNHVTLDVQRYILARLDSEPRLRQHVSRDAAQALDHLRIKSNGCFLYLERVLDGLADGSVALREIREIPGTLNGLYLWLCQRLFHGRKFVKVQPLLNVILAAKCGVTIDMLYKCLLMTNCTTSREDFNRRFHLLKRILIIESSTGYLSIFHHSFSEWLLDVKHCTRRFLCNTTAGHASLAMYYTLKGDSLAASEVHRFVLHMTKVEQDIETIKQQSSNRDSKSSQEPDNVIDKPINSDVFYTFDEHFQLDFHTLALLWIIDSGCPVESSLRTKLETVTVSENKTLSETNLSNNKLMNNASSHSIGSSSGEVPDFIADCFQCPTLPRDTRVLRALLEMGASIEGPTLVNEQNQLEQSIEGTKTLESGEISDGQMIDSMDIRASQISLEHLLVMEAEQEEEVDGNDVTCTNEEALQLCLIDASTGRAPIHALAQAGDIHALTLAQALQAFELAGGCIKEALELVDRAGQTALQLAARGGRRAAVSLLLKKGASANTPDSEGWTPLRAAAWGGHTEVVELLLKHGCEVDCVDSDQRTALRAAAWSGHEEIVRLLLAHGADVNRADGEGRTALIAAAYMGHTDIVAHLLDHGAHIDHADSDGRTALAVAALCSAGGAGSAACAQLLLERGAAPSRPDKDGMTPLLVAAFEGHKDVMELLLESEADPEASDKAGRTPLWAAAAAGHAGAVRILLFWGCCVDTIDRDGRTVLSVAAAQGNVDVVRQLVDRGLDEHHKDNAGWTPLHYASFEGHMEVCEVLLEAGAKVDEKDNDGKGPLMLASQEGHCRLMEYLIDEWGAPVDQHAHDGKTALRVSALEGHYEAVRILVERGANVDAMDADQRSTLYILALDNRVSMARYLIQRAGADVETRDSEGRTPLHVSAWQGHYEMVNLLLIVGGCNVDARDAERRTPLHSASWRGQSAVVRLLLSRGADPQAECDQGATPLGIASQEGHEECVMWLLQHGANPKHTDRCGRTPAKVALRAGHLNVCRLLERWGATATPQTQSSLQPDGGTNTSGSTAETRLCTASLTNNRLSPVPIAHNQAGSPDSKRRSVHSSNSTKSSSNLTSSTVSSSHHDNMPVLQPPDLDKGFNHQQQSANRSGLALSFAQQVARCGRRSGRGNSGVTSPLYATPPHSPLSDICSPTQPPSSGLNILSSIAQQFGSSHHQQQQQPQENTTDRHFCRDTHMRIILGRDNKHSPTTGAGIASGDNRDRCRMSSTTTNGTSPAGTSRLSCRRLVGSIGKIARRKKTTSPGVSGGKSKRNGIVTNPAMRLVANVKNGLDTAAANLRRTGVALAASASSNNPAVKTNAFQWKKETPL